MIVISNVIKNEMIRSVEDVSHRGYTKVNYTTMRHNLQHAPWSRECWGLTAGDHCNKVKDITQNTILHIVLQGKHILGNGRS